MNTEIDINTFYSEMKNENIILSYKGDISQELISSLYPIIENRLEEEVDDQKRRKKIFHVLVECLQNILHHMETFRSSAEFELMKGNVSGQFMMTRRGDGGYNIFTGNFILNKNFNVLKERIDKVNSMDSNELKAFYLGSLSTSELSEKGGAGLGIIDMARKSENKLEYKIHQLSDVYSFFTLAVKIN